MASHNHLLRQFTPVQSSSLHPSGLPLADTDRHQSQEPQQQPTLQVGNSSKSVLEAGNAVDPSFGTQKVLLQPQARRLPQQTPLAQQQAARQPMDVAYRSDAYPGSTWGGDDYHRDGMSSHATNSSSSHQHYGMPDADPAPSNSAAFWPVPRPAQGYPGTVHAYIRPEMHALSAYAHSIKQEQSSYTYDSASPIMRHPIVYSQPAGQPHHSLAWSESNSSYTEYPTAPYIAQAQAQTQAQAQASGSFSHTEPHQAHHDHSYPSQLAHQHHLHGHPSHHGVYGAYGDDESGSMVGSGEGPVATGPRGPGSEFYDSPETAVWPLASSQFGPAGAPSVYGMPGPPMPGSPDKGKSRVKSGPPVPLPKQFKCSACDAIFSRNHDLKRHARIHLAVKPFPCGWCDKAFSRKDALKRHILVKGCGIGSKKGQDSRRKSRSSLGGGSSSLPPPAAASKPHGEMQEGDGASHDSSFDSYSINMTRKNSGSSNVSGMYDMQASGYPAAATGAPAWPSAAGGGASEYSSYPPHRGAEGLESSALSASTLANAYPPPESRFAYGTGPPNPSSYSDGAGNVSRPGSSHSSAHDSQHAIYARSTDADPPQPYYHHHHPHHRS